MHACYMYTYRLVCIYIYIYTLYICVYIHYMKYIYYMKYMIHICIHVNKLYVYMSANFIYLFIQYTYTNNRLMYWESAIFNKHFVTPYRIKTNCINFLGLNFDIQAFLQPSSFIYNRVPQDTGVLCLILLILPQLHFSLEYLNIW